MVRVPGHVVSSAREAGGVLCRVPYSSRKLVVAMKLIVAIVRSEKLEAVQVALQETYATLLCVSQVVGRGQDDRFTEIYRGREVRVPRPKLKLEIAVSDEQVQRVVAVIAQAGGVDGPGRQGNSNVFVMQLEECVRIAAREAEPLAVAK